MNAWAADESDWNMLKKWIFGQSVFVLWSMENELVTSPLNQK